VTTRLPHPDYYNHPHLAPSAHLVTDEVRAEAVNLFAPLFQRNYAEWLRIGRADFDARIEGPGDETLRTLQRDGVSILKIPADLKARLVEATKAEVDAIEEKLANFEGKPKFRDMNVALPRDQWGHVYKLVQKIFDKLQVLEVGGAYVKRPLRIKRLYVQLNNATETRQRYGVIDENGIPERKSDYWHIDSDIWPNFKSLIYLNDVGIDEGPMRYIPGTHRDLDAFETVVRKTNDSLKLSTAQFLGLPDPLRMHALFGPYMKGDEPEVQALLEREVACCGNGGDVVLFDNNGVHRGGFVRKGSRRIMQVLFEPV
jgi:hypothetical protein